MTLWYLDSSVALHALLPTGDDRARQWIDQVRADGGELYSSTLLRLEMIRVLRREQRDPQSARAVLDRVNQVSLDDGVLRFAETIEPHLRSLDAIHLATCMLVGPMAVATHDATMRSVAEYLDLETFDPLA